MPHPRKYCAFHQQQAYKILQNLVPRLILLPPWSVKSLPKPLRLQQNTRVLFGFLILLQELARCFLKLPLFCSYQYQILGELLPQETAAQTRALISNTSLGLWHHHSVYVVSCTP